MVSTFPPEIHPTIHPLLHQALMQPDGRSGPAVWPQTDCGGMSSAELGGQDTNRICDGTWTLPHNSNQCHVLARVTVNRILYNIKYIDIHIKEAVKTIEKGD